MTVDPDQLLAWTLKRFTLGPVSIKRLTKDLQAAYPSLSPVGCEELLTSLVDRGQLQPFGNGMLRLPPAPAVADEESEEKEKITEDDQCLICLRLMTTLFQGEPLLEDPTGALYRRVDGGMFANTDLQAIVPTISQQFYAETGLVVLKRAIERALNTYPRETGPTPALRFHLFDHDGHRLLYVNQGDGTVLLVNHHNWITVGIEAIPDHIRFISSPAMGVMPTPVSTPREPGPYSKPHEGIWKLKPLLRLTPDQFVQAVGWMIMAALTDYPCPMLYIEGPHGSGKTMMAYFVVNTVDPYKSMRVAVRRPTVLDGDDLGLNVNANTTLLIDNVTGITQKVSDDLCTMITGGSDIKRKLYTNTEKVLVEYRGAICMTSIGTVGMGADLVDRRVAFVVPPIEDRQGTGNLLADYEEMLPALLGDLLPLIVQASLIVDEGTSPHVRMVNYLNVLRYLDNMWGTSAAPAYERAHINSTAAAIFNDVIGVPVLQWLDKNPGITEFYPSDLYRDLSVLHSIDNKAWPTEARFFSQRLRKLDAAFRQCGYCFASSDKRDRSKGTPILVSTCDPDVIPEPVRYEEIWDSEEEDFWPEGLE